MKNSVMFLGLAIALGCSGSENEVANLELTREQQLRRTELIDNIDFSTLVGTPSSELDELFGLADKCVQLEDENKMKQYIFFDRGSNDDGTECDLEIFVACDQVVHWSLPITLD